jgi:hypothetical protein
MNSWLYEDKEFTDVEDYYGFIYLIENLVNGRKYIGRKYLTKAGYKTVKGKRKKLRVESDWRDYYGSSTSLKEDIDHYGKDNFRRTILRLCKSRGECNYFETKYIFDTDAILDPQYYNSWVSCKIQTSHVKALLFNPEQENL